MKILSLHQASSGTTSAGMGKGASSLLVGVKVKALHLAFAHMDGSGSPVLLQCLAGLEQLLSRNVFLGCPFPSILTRKNRLLLGLLLSVPIDISRLPASLAPNPGSMRLRENPGTSPSSRDSGPQISSRSLLLTLQVHLVFASRTMPWVSRCAYRVAWGKIHLFRFPRCGSSLYFFFFVTF